MSNFLQTSCKDLNQLLSSIQKQLKNPFCPNVKIAMFLIKAVLLNSCQGRGRFCLQTCTVLLSLWCHFFLIHICFRPGRNLYFSEEKNDAPYSFLSYFAASYKSRVVWHAVVLGVPVADAERWWWLRKKYIKQSENRWIETRSKKSDKFQWPSG